MTVRELVGDEVLSITPDDTLRKAARLMKTNDIGSLAVEVGGLLEGIITERDILSACAEGADFESARVDGWMTSYPDTLQPDMSVEYAASWMTAAGYRHLPVVDDETTIGIVSIKDILWALTDSLVK